MNISQSFILVSIIVIAILVLLVIAIGKKRGLELPINKPNFASGLLIVGVAVTLLLMDIIESGVAALIGIVGIGLIAASGGSYMKRSR